MNTQLFIQQLEAFSDTQWQAIANGYCVSIKDDEQLIINDDTTSHIIIDKNTIDDINISNIKACIVSQAESLLQQFYLTHPLSQAGFNKQVFSLIQEHGIEKFISTDLQPAEFSLFVEGNKVITEDSTSPRHCYGIYFTAETLENSSEQQAMDWINSGEAHELYLSMNVCRYNC